jgi:hypothetical protein
MLIEEYTEPEVDPKEVWANVAKLSLENGQLKQELSKVNFELKILKEIRDFEDYAISEGILLNKRSGNNYVYPGTLTAWKAFRAGRKSVNA